MKHRTSDAERDNDSDAPQQRDLAPAAGSTNGGGTVASIHEAAGNQAVQQLHERGALQASMDVSHPDDREEREAERVAEEVLRGDESTHEGRSPTVTGRTSDGTDGSGTLDSETEAEIRAVTSGGQPLPESTRSFFESRFGRDFSDVRVHTGTEADRSARSINAEAFTMGSHIVFGGGNFRSAASGGRELIAHELAHVVQHSASSRPKRVHRQAASASGGQGRQPPTTDSYESDRTTTYVVQPGDTLWDIAERQYGDGRLWPAIHRANRDKIDDPNRIYPGQELTIPPRSEAEAASRRASSEETARETSSDGDTSSDGETMTFSEEEAVSVSSESETTTTAEEETATTTAEGETKETTAAATGESGGWLDSSLQWVWGVLQGDFKEDPSVSQVVVRTLLTLIPYVDQVADVQDLTAAVYKLAWQERTDEFGPWFDLFLTAVGFIPELGSAIKGVVKVIRKSDGGTTLLKKLSGLTDDVPKLLNRMIDTLEDNRKFIGEKAAELLRSFARKADNIASKLEAVPWVVPMSDKMGELAAELRRVASNCRELAKEAPEKMDEIIDEVVDDLKDARRRIEDDDVDQKPPRKGPKPDETPRTLAEQLTLQEARAGAGEVLPMRDLADEPRLVDNYGPGEWVKKQHIHRKPNGDKINVHWFHNESTGQDVEFKFKTRDPKAPVNR